MHVYIHTHTHTHTNKQTHTHHSFVHLFIPFIFTFARVTLRYGVIEKQSNFVKYTELQQYSYYKIFIYGITDHS